MQKQPTIRDVAQAAGVSVAVVSRVLNPGSGPVAVATRSRVNDVMQNLGYHPRTAARELKYGPPHHPGAAACGCLKPVLRPSCRPGGAGSAFPGN